MTHHNDSIDRVMDELERYGLRGTISERGKHLEIAWETPLGRRFVIAPRTPSDWRAGLNLRSDLRKLLKADNLQPKQITNLSFQKAMSLPKEVLVTREQTLQNDVDSLVDLVFELQTQIAMLQTKFDTMRVVATIEFGAPAEVMQVEQHHPKQYQDNNPFRQGSAQYNIVNCLSHQYKSVHDIVKETGVHLKYVATTLSKAKRLGCVELGLRGMWRRK